MRLKASLFILLAIYFSFSVKAENTNVHPGVHKYKADREYHQNWFQFDSSKPCEAPFCVPAGLTIKCSKYSYVATTTRGTTMQFCHISELTGESTLKVPESANYTMATGYYDSKGFHSDLPSNFTMKVGLNNTVPQPTQPEAGVTADCASGRCEELKKIVNDFTDLLAVAAPGFITPVPQNEAAGNLVKSELGSGEPSTRLATLCDNFINEDGKLGSYGVQVLDAIKRVGWGCFSGEPTARQPVIDVSTVCPNFRKFDKSTKEFFWVWVFASIANKESSCNANEQNPLGANDIADGLMQMEYSAEQRMAAGRNSKFCPHHSINSKDVKFQLECSASILKDYNCKLAPPLLTSSTGYWHRLRGVSVARTKRGQVVGGAIISHNIKKFPGCYDK